MRRIPSPPKKKSKPLLLEAPGTEDHVSEANKFTYKAPGSYGSDKEPTEDADLGEQEDEDDDFAKMVCLSISYPDHRPVTDR
jgi:hypothetical protein